jgi:type IV secretory pathway TraG/TraD family ATPase VirD4
MKRILLAALLALSGATAHAQNAAETCQTPLAESIRKAAAAGDKDALHKLYDQEGLTEAFQTTPERLDARFSGVPCARIEGTLRTISGIGFSTPSLDSIEAKEAIAAQDQANIDLLNGIKAQLSSGQRASVLAGLEAFRAYFERAETAFAGKGLKACDHAEGSVSWGDTPCDPMPAVTRRWTRERNRLGLGWPEGDSPAKALAWMKDRYESGPEEEKPRIQSVADGFVFDTMPFNLMARVELLGRAQIAASAAETRKAAREAKAAYESGVVGNFTSIGSRFKESLWDIVGGLLGVFLLPVVLTMIPFLGPFLRSLIPLEKMARGLFLLWLVSLPFHLVHILFGGMLRPLVQHLPTSAGWLPKAIGLALFIGACVLVQRSSWYGKLYGYLPARLRNFAATPRGTATAAAAPVVAAGGLHGSAHWSNTQAGINGGRYQPDGHVLADSHGFTLGRAPDAASKALAGFDSRLRYMGHVLTVAPNGSGKGIGAVIPALLDYPGSTIVLDVKGENYAVTARFRREQLGHDVYLVDPFGVIQQHEGEVAATAKTHGFNWLDRLNPDSPDVVGESATLADMLVVSEGHASDASAHFNETAKMLIRGIMVHVACGPEEQRNMGEVRRLLTMGGDAFDLLLAQMMTNPRGFDLPARAANAFNDAPDKERGSILSTARRHLAFLDDPRITAALSRSDFSVDDLKKRRMTIYLVMPPARLASNRAFVRAFFGQAINAVMAGAGKPDYRVLFLLDEFPQLGRMDIVEEKLPLIRGYGGAFWLVAQNLAQLKETYPRWQNFIANCGAKQFFGTADVETARYVSDSLGKMTVEFQTANTSSGTSFGQGVNSNSGAGHAQQFTGRELMTADEIMRLPREQEIVLVTGEAPWMLHRLNYLRDAEYAGRFDPNPYE